MSDWQPIEAAPKDGTWVLLYAEEPRALIVGPVAVGSSTGGDWYDSHGYTIRPTHWQPAPDPPPVCVSGHGPESPPNGSTPEAVGESSRADLKSSLPYIMKVER